MNHNQRKMEDGTEQPENNDCEASRDWGQLREWDHSHGTGRRLTHSQEPGTSTSRPVHEPRAGQAAAPVHFAILAIDGNIFGE